MNIRIGRLRHRLELQRPVEARSSSGAVTKTWTTDSTVWAAIEPLSGREFLAISQTQNETTVRVVIRYHSTIDKTWRGVHNGKSYSIQSIINHDERNHWMTLMCSEGVVEKVVAAEDEFFVVNNSVNVVNNGTQVIHTS